MKNSFPRLIDVNEFYLAIDVRLASESHLASGIAQYIIGLTHALVLKLTKEQSFSNNNKIKIKKIILVNNVNPPTQWIVDLLNQYPDLVGYWSDDRGFTSKFITKPLWLWSTLAFRKLNKLSHKRLIWFAAGNFDRPLFVSRSKYVHRVIQVVHDTIPFSPQIRGIGWVYKLQFKYLVKRALNKLPLLVAASPGSVKMLEMQAKKRTRPLYTMNIGIDAEFGQRPKIVDSYELSLLRERFLRKLKLNKFSSCLQEYYWVIGVGRNQGYKRWDLAQEAIQQLNQSFSKKIWFLRVGSDLILSDAELAELYYLADLLIHPSEIEGFGIPPLEAALSGTPVLYRAKTAVELHFSQGTMPSHFWYGVDSNDPQVWAEAIKTMLEDKRDSKFFKELNASTSTREFIVQQNYAKSFEWNETALALLEILNENGRFIVGL